MRHNPIKSSPDMFNAELQQNNTLSKNRASIAFGIFIKKNYKEEMSNVLYIGSGYLKSFRVGNSVNASNVKITTRSLIDAKNNLKARSLKAKTSVMLGKNASIKEGIESGLFYVEAGDGLKAQYIKAKTNVKLGKNAVVKEGIESETQSVEAGDGLRAKTIIARGKVTLGSVKDLEEIHLLKNRKAGTNEAELILNNEDLKTKNADGKIRLCLGDIDTLIVKTPTGMREILYKFELYREPVLELENGVCKPDRTNMRQLTRNDKIRICVEKI